MAETAIEHAPAKVNLALHVTGRKVDGYHLLDTLVVFTDAGDRVSVRPSAYDSFSIEGPFAAQLRGQGDNLVLRARDLLREVAGNAPPVAITLEKNLPIESGIGGGSSDAAATLRALIRLWNVAIGERALGEAGLRLGADLPMCMAATALRARGIGEEIEAVAGLPPFSLVLVNPGVAAPTPAIFRALVNRENEPLPALPAGPDFAALVAWLATTRNDLEAPARLVAPQVADALAALRASGAALARMSGSGATCFGLFASGEEAVLAAAAIAARQPSWYVKATSTVERAMADVAH